MFIRPTTGRISSPFGPRIHPETGKPSFHQGVDFANPIGTAILAAADGKVFRVGELDSYGNVVMIHHVIKGKVYETVYAHLDTWSVKVGQVVKQGQQIARMGNTGRSTGPHLHFEIHDGRWSKGQPDAIDPLVWIPLEVALKRGNKGHNVAVVQDMLIQIGYLKTADGSFGPTTESAVKAFQVSRKLDVDGKVGPKTLEALRTAILPQLEPKKEVDEMAEQLPNTQKDDMKKLLTKAYKEKVFSVDHSPKVDTMTRGQATDLLISYVARTK